MQLRLSTNDSLDDIGDISADVLTSLPRHRWYFLKEAFSPNVANRAILDADCAEGGVVFDPFSGSGTVSVAALQHGCQAVGLEVNPFLRFVSETKLTQCDPDEFLAATPAIEEAILEGQESPLRDFSTFSAGGGRKKWLFNKCVLDGFEAGWDVSKEVRPSSKNLSRLALIGAALDVCNATKDGKCLRYRPKWKERCYDEKDLLKAFSERVNAVASDLENAPVQRNDSYIREADARTLLGGGQLDKKFDVCVMSPPYLNSFDYTDVYRPELFLGKFIANMDELRELRLRTLRSHIQVKWEDPTDSDFGARYTECIQRVAEKQQELWSQRILLMIQAYFQDMREVLKGLLLKAKDNASTWIVVSTSAYAGIEVPVDLILSDIAEQVGWKIRMVEDVRKLRRVSAQQWDVLSQNMSNGEKGNPYLRESVIVLDK